MKWAARVRGFGEAEVNLAYDEGRLIEVELRDRLAPMLECLPGTWRFESDHLQVIAVRRRGKLTHRLTFSYDGAGAWDVELDALESLDDGIQNAEPLGIGLVLVGGLVLAGLASWQQHWWPILLVPLPVLGGLWLAMRSSTVVARPDLARSVESEVADCVRKVEGLALVEMLGD